MEDPSMGFVTSFLSGRTVSPHLIPLPRTERTGGKLPGAAGAWAGGFFSALQPGDTHALSCLLSSFRHSLINPALLSASFAILFYGLLPSLFIKHPGTGKAVPLKIRLMGRSESA